MMYLLFVLAAFVTAAVIAMSLFFGSAFVAGLIDRRRDRRARDAEWARLTKAVNGGGPR